MTTEIATTRTTTPSTAAPKLDHAEDARDIAGTVLGVAQDAVSRIPDAASSTREAISDATRTMQAGSSARLSAGTLIAFGFAFGLLIGGAHRLLVLAALIPAAAMGVTLLDRGATPQRDRPLTPR
jgi:hypothetical protein